MILSEPNKIHILYTLKWIQLQFVHIIIVSPVLPISLFFYMYIFPSSVNQLPPDEKHLLLAGSD